MHSKKITINSICNIAYKIFTICFGLISRRIILVFLSEEILGLSSLFSSVLDLLNMADMGLGVSLQYLLYSPLARNDSKRITEILAGARKFFRFVFWFILLVGTGLSFFLEYLIKSNPYDNVFIQICFLINVFSVALTYLNAYKRIYFQANEQGYVCNNIDMIVYFFACVLKILVIVITKNYIAFLLVSIVSSFATNIILDAMWKKKKLPEIDYQNDNGNISTEFIKSVKDILPARLANYVYSSTDTLLISHFLGLVESAKYNNFFLIITSVTSIIGIIAVNVVPSWGIYSNEAESKDLLKVFKCYELIQFFLSGFCSLCLLFLMGPFVSLWMGEKYVYSQGIILLLVIQFYSSTVLYPLNAMTNSLGLFKGLKKIAIVVMMVNLIVSIGSIYFWGVAGVIAGTIVANIVNIGMHSKLVICELDNSYLPSFLRNNFEYCFATIFCGAIIAYVFNMIQWNGIGYIRLCFGIVIIFIVFFVCGIVVICVNEKRREAMLIIINKVKTLRRERE